VAYFLGIPVYCALQRANQVPVSRHLRAELLVDAVHHWNSIASQ